MIKPLLMENAVIQISSIDDVELGIYLCLYNQMGRRYSFCVKIEKIEVSEDKEKILFVDKNIVGPIGSGDYVDIIPFKVPIAERITLVIPSSTHVVGGDWGTLLGEQLDGQILDVGSELIFTYPSELNPVLLTGILRTANPSPPVKLLHSTRVMVEKEDQETISSILNRSNEFKELRMLEYEKQIENQVFNLIGQIKTDKVESVRITLDFTAEPRMIFSGIKSILHSCNIISESFDVLNEATVGLLSLVYRHELPKPKKLIEFNLYSTLDKGKLNLSVYSVDENPHEIADKIAGEINSLVIGISTAAKIIDDSCPNCSLRLDFSSNDERGWVKCNGCRQFIEIPAKYRLI